MRRLFKRVMDLSSDNGFLDFQNDLSRRIYDALSQGYSLNENEVSLVKRVVEAMNGQSYGGINIHSSFIHGSRSYVEFNYMDRPVTKELGDMAVFALVTDGPERLVQKACIVQNKKGDKEHWTIDPEQLYLLKNFPPLSGTKGILRGSRNVAFRNSSGCLGCYGLLLQPGEMILASAPMVTEMLRGRGTLPLADVTMLPNGNTAPWNAGQPFPLWGMLGWRHPRDIHMIFEELVHEFGYPLLGSTLNGFLGNVAFTRDVHDLARSITQFSIGEPTLLFGRATNPAVDAFSNHVIRSAKLENLPVDLPPDNLFGDHEFDGQMAVVVVHMDVSGSE
ncbi:MAG: hypothetical protein HYX78_09635 [Armatimonadetes bacterium]|nr:hypothetical protein [Armatimonadota bacterium]